MTLPIGETRSIETTIDTLTYTLRRTSRRRTVGVFVEPDGAVSVLAPTDAETPRIEQILRRRVRWIRRQQRTVEALPTRPSPRQWVAGETHRYLGRQYRLKLAKGSTESVRLWGGYFVVTSPNPLNRSVIKRLMGSWYRDHAIALFHDRAQRVLASTTWLDFDMPRITIRTLRQRWGSTTPSGRISFNVDLVRVPLPCIDYVVAHELVHLLIPNHSPAFWRMLGRVMPDWRRWRERLKLVEV